VTAVPGALSRSVTRYRLARVRDFPDTGRRRTVSLVNTAASGAWQEHQGRSRCPDSP